MSKEITLGDWLKGIGEGGCVCLEYSAETRLYHATLQQHGHVKECPYRTPEDALQALCEAYHRDDDALLDLDRSAKWNAAHGPDGVAGLCDGEAGVVVCRDGALVLVEKVTCQDDVWTRPDPGYPRQAPDAPATVAVPNTFETGLPAVYPNPPAEPTTDEEGELDAPEPSRAECLKASLESLLSAYMNYPAGSPGEDTLRNHLLKVLVESVAYLLEWQDAKEEGMRKAIRERLAGYAGRPIETSIKEEAETDATEESD
jgi:hypothetical protein